MWKQCKWIIKLFTTLSTYGFFLVMCYLFVGMFINGGTLEINCISLGEDVIEYPMMLIFFPLFTYGTYLNYKELVDDKINICKTKTTRP